MLIWISWEKYFLNLEQLLIFIPCREKIFAFYTWTKNQVCPKRLSQSQRFFKLSMQWSVQPENLLDLTKSKLNTDHSQRSRFMTNIREKYETVRISQNRNRFLIWFLDYSSRCESSWCILGPSWYTSKKIRSIWLCWGCPSYQKQTYRYTRRFQDGFRSLFLVHFLAHFCLFPSKLTIFW